MDTQAFERDLMKFDAASKAAAATSSKKELTVNASLRELGEEIKRCTEAARNRLAGVREKYREKWPRSPLFWEGSIFQPLGLSSKEVPFTRALAWWLGSSRSSKLSCESLAAFVADVTRTPNIEAGQMQDWRVRAERCFDDPSDPGRVDILLEGKLGLRKCCIAIEAKINAREGKNQLKTYASSLVHQYRTGDGWEKWIVLLTMKGTPPHSSDQRHRVDVVSMNYSRLLACLLPPFRRADASQEGTYDAHEIEFGRMLLADIARLGEAHLGLGGTNVFSAERALLASTGDLP